MARIRGQHGKVYLGGFSTLPLDVDGAHVAGAANVSLRKRSGIGTVEGVLLAGDQFQIAGDATLYTVTGGPYIAIAGGFTDVRMAPVLAAAAADGAEVTLGANVPGQLSTFDFDATRGEIELGIMGREVATYDLGPLDYRGSLGLYLDETDAQHQRLIDDLLSPVVSERQVGATMLPAGVQSGGYYGLITLVSAQLAGEWGGVFDFTCGFVAAGQQWGRGA